MERSGLINIVAEEQLEAVFKTSTQDDHSWLEVLFEPVTSLYLNGPNEDQVIIYGFGEVTNYLNPLIVNWHRRWKAFENLEARILQEVLAKFEPLLNEKLLKRHNKWRLVLSDVTQLW